MARQDLIKLNRDLKDAIDLARTKKLTEQALKPFFGGVQAIQGIQGIQGENGLDGKDGKDGKNGVNGKDGKDGINGRDGKDGHDGKDGKDGLNGKDGVGIDGRDGIDGKDGLNGIDGTLIPGEVIVDKINALPTDIANQIDASHIKNLPNPVFGGRGGGVGIQEIVAGSNITVLRHGNKVTVNSTASASAGTGDVVGPALAVDNRVAFFDGATGKIIKDNGITLTGTNTGDQVADGVTITGTGTAIDPFVGVAGSGISRTISSVAINTTGAAAAFTDYVYLCSGTIDFTLPTAVGNTNLYTIKNVGVGVITCKPTGAETLDGEATQPITVQYSSLSFISNNSNWLIV